MAVPPVLVVTFVFDPPKVIIVGPIANDTIHKLEEMLPLLSHNTGSLRRPPSTFVCDNTLVLRNWSIELIGHVTDEVSRIMIFLAVLECLEEEEGWLMRDTMAANDGFDVIHTMIFTSRRKQ
eukprot:Tbor_TRINITY_DN2258_c0_g1::TRINITY_DN2258_c0_g1_i1::g.2802::m.2802